jgi:CheY-like chemotaxis protein
VSKILIVDDESNLRFLLRMTFELAGHEVSEASHGAAALEVLAESQQDLIVTDFMMPVMDGRELIAQLRADPATAAIPVIVVTATMGAATFGADAVFSKPFDPHDVLLSADELMEMPR